MALGGVADLSPIVATKIIVRTLDIEIDFRFLFKAWLSGDAEVTPRCQRSFRFIFRPSVAVEYVILGGDEKRIVLTILRLLYPRDFDIILKHSIVFHS